ncbi:unnamed protein product [Allacma fusca]|uniref:Uncharacterized protein n=1 Tax=Allacma fusca TaxID=39272 RepID=A0A8J2KPK3_9HEXA|nr:unnamed protein product [Allacma fusca]
MKIQVAVCSLVLLLCLAMAFAEPANVLVKPGLITVEKDSSLEVEPREARLIVVKKYHRHRHHHRPPFGK